MNYFKLAFILALIVGGFVWFAYLTSWKVALALYIIIWANNMDQKPNRR